MCDELKEINCKISRYDCKLDNVNKKIKELENIANGLKKEKNENISMEKISDLDEKYKLYNTVGFPQLYHQNRDYLHT